MASALPMVAFLFVSCGDSNASNTDNASSVVSDTITNPSTKLTPTGPKPVWAPNIDPEMQVVIDKLASYGDQPLETLTAQEARTKHTPTDAVMDVMKEHNIQPTPSVVDTTGKEIPVSGGTVHARIYTPSTGDSLMPIIVYYHGGGWVIANLDTYDASAKGMAEQTKAIVVSVHYRQAPEHKFPTAHNDAFAAYQWVLKNATSLKGDSKMIAVMGESAGGNLACNVSIMARDRKIQMPVHQVLVYPVASKDMNSESYLK